MNNAYSGAGLLALVLASTALMLTNHSANAQDAANPDLSKCLSETDDQRRLACFDELASTLSTDAAPGEVAPPDREPPVAEATPAISAAAPAATPEPEIITEVAPAAASTAPVVVESAGSVPQQPAETEPAQSGANTGEFTAVVRKVDEMPRGEHVVYFENGEVWAEQIATRYFPVEPGDTITMKKRRFGGYRLITESGKAYNVKKLN